MTGRGPELLAVASFPAPHAFTTRSGGVSVGPYASLNVGASVGDDPEAVAANRRAVLASFGADPDRTATVTQVHGTRVLDAREASPDDEADALICDDPAWTLAVSVADCLPVLLVDPDRLAVGAAHAGWRGLVGGVLEATIAGLEARFGVRPEALHAVVGPHVSGPRYQVGPEVVEALDAAGLGGPHAAPDGVAPGRYRLDLGAAARLALARAGVPEGRIADGGWCTASDAGRFFSHRRDAGRTGRHWALVRPPGARG